MSAEDNFEIVLRGVGGHAARPQWGKEVLVAACATVMNLQTIVSRRLSPNDIGVVSVAELITDGTRNALAGLARILGDARSFRPEISAEIEKHMRMIAEGTGRTYDVAVEVNYTRQLVPLLNDPFLVDEAFVAARTVSDHEHVATAREPMTASEDFARFLEHAPVASCSSVTASVRRHCTIRRMTSMIKACSTARTSMPPSSGSDCRCGDFTARNCGNRGADDGFGS